MILRGKKKIQNQYRRGVMREILELIFHTVYRSLLTPLNVKNEHTEAALIPLEGVSKPVSKLCGNKTKNIQVRSHGLHLAAIYLWP